MTTNSSDAGTTPEAADSTTRSAGCAKDVLSSRGQTALDIIAEAGQLAREWFEKGSFDIEVKNDGTPVTKADRDVETLLRGRLEEAFPQDGIFGEEFDEEHGTSGCRWILDPIDGTKSFVRGVPLYGTLLAYEDNGTMTFGAIALPSLSQTIYAERGRGCWANGKQVSVSQTSDLRDAHVMATWLEDWGLDVLGRMRKEGAIIRTWGDAYGYSLVATGRADALVDFTARVYDLAAPSVIIKEAGGCFTDKAGAPGVDGGGAVASNGVIHREIVDLING